MSTIFLGMQITWCCHVQNRQSRNDGEFLTDRVTDLSDEHKSNVANLGHQTIRVSNGARLQVRKARVESPSML